ncbi:MAG TPA: M23 family metallopeptidase [Pilimelia sp.]|nr:M23 family metallopeptidase [Pilimelia sp.]
MTAQVAKDHEQARRPVRRAGLLVALTAALALLCCGGSVSAFFLGDLGQPNPNAELAALFGCGEGGPVDADGELPRINRLSETQMRNAAIIINVGADLGVPPRGWVIAIATALQESVLKNLPHLGKRNDHDSVGLFQQRPSQGWGSVRQIQDPVYAATQFYKRLLRVNGWEDRPLTEVAQAVQRSAFPDAYAKHEALASQIVNLLADGAARAVEVSGRLRCAAPGEIAASGWTAPVKSAVGSGFRTNSRPGHDGVDLSAGRYTPIRAASSGIVTHIECDNDSSPPYRCDRDGSPSTPGCGWYAEITHADNVITRYCHMVVRPSVKEGQSVAAGQVIGQVGTSGHSSGPHLHFEVHLHGDRSATGAVDPVDFMRERGAALGPQEA